MDDRNLSTSSEFAISRDAGTLTIRIVRESKKNAFSLAMWKELGRLFAALATESEVRAVILSGSGGSFSAGADISEFHTVRATAQLAQAYEFEVDRCLEAIIKMPQPTIAAIRGACVGGGFALAQSCDFRIADETAYFSIPAARVGIVYGISKCQRLLSLVGLTNATRILFTGKKIGCADANACGFVDQLATGDVVDVARSLAGELALSAPLSVAGMKAILRSIAAGDVERQRTDLELAIRTADDSADHREAVAAFAEKRPPRFRGV